MSIKIWRAVALVSVLFLFITYALGAGCLRKTAGANVDQVGKEQMKDVAPESTDTVPVLDKNGNPMFDEDGNMLVEAKTSILEDAIGIADRAKLKAEETGEDWFSIFWRDWLRYIMGYVLSILGTWIAGRKGLKKKIYHQDQAIDVMTRGINVAFGRAATTEGSNGPVLGGILSWLTNRIESKSIKKGREVAAIIDESVNKTGDGHTEAAFRKIKFDVEKIVS